MCWISWPCEWQWWMAATPMLVKAHICHPEELSRFSRVLGMAVLGTHSPSALESEKTNPSNRQTDSQNAACSFRIVLWQRLCDWTWGEGPDPWMASAVREAKG